MEQVLSQDEVNALLSGLDGDQAEPEVADEAPDDSGITRYNLGARDSVNWGYLPSLQMICEKFSRSMQEMMASELLDDVVVSLDDFIYRPFQDFVDTLPIPSSFTICRLEPLQGSGVFIMEAELVANMMDQFFGGKNQTHVKLEGRDFTAVERHFIHKISDYAMGFFREAWEGVHPITFEYQRTEINSQFAMVIGATDMAVCCRFKVELNHQETDMYMVFPYSALEPIKEKLASIFKGESMVADSTWVRDINDRAFETSLTLSVELGTTDYPLGDVARWKVGDVVLLPNKVTDPLQITVEEVPKFWGYPGERDGYVSFQIHGALEQKTQREAHNG